MRPVSRPPGTGGDPATVRRRLVLITGGLSALVALLLVLVVQVVLAGAATDAVARVLQDRADAVISSARARAPDPSRPADPVLEIPAERLDPGVAVYDPAGDRVAGSVPPSLGEAFGRLSSSEATELVEVGDAYSLLGQPFRTDAGAEGVVVLAEPLAPYENDEQAALLVSLAAGAVMVLLATGLTSWVSHRALSPVRDMARTAEQWSEQDLDRRFDLGPPTDEIKALGRTLDGLLEKVALAIQTEQRLTSELAHELRTPLTTVQATAELASARSGLDDRLVEDLDDIRDAARTMSATITVLLEIARDQASSSPGETCTGPVLADRLAGHYRDRAAPQVDLPAGLELLVPVEVTVRALVPVIDNGLRVAGTVRVSARPAGAHEIDLVVSDDGPGVDTSLRPTLFRPGVSTGGSGLGLSLARRVARSAGGEVRLEADEGPGGDRPGARFVVRLPGRLGAPEPGG